MLETLLNTIPFFATIAFVKCMQKLGYIQKEFIKAVGSITFNIVTPVYIVFLMQDISLKVSDIKYVLFGILSFLVFGGVALLLSKMFHLSKKREGTLLVGFLSFSVGIVVYPLVQLNYSNDTFLQLVLYDCFGLFFLFMTITYALASYYGTLLSSAKVHAGSMLESIKKVGASPVVISMFIGLAVSLLRIQHLLLTNTYTYISNAFGLLVATLLALSLSLPKRKGIFQLFLFASVKLLTGLITGVAIAKIFHLPDDIAQIVILATAAPVSASALIFTEQEGLDTEWMGQFTAVSLLLGLAILPVIIAIL
jgi:predicted permease